MGFCGHVDVQNFARFVFQRLSWFREAFFGFLFSPFRGGLELAHHSPPARLNIDILDRHLLLPFATISIERFNWRKLTRVLQRAADCCHDHRMIAFESLNDEGIP